MNLSELPLMPSAEVPEAAPAPAPEPSKVSSTFDWVVEDTLAGCACPSCERARELDRTRAAHPPAVNPIVWVGSNPSPISQQRFDISQAFAAATSTGRISASAPQVANLPRSAPPVQESRRIRGRYSHPTSGLSGAVRWREPGTLGVWDNFTGGEEQWVFRQEDADGSLRGGPDHQMQWYPTEV